MQPPPVSISVNKDINLQNYKSNHRTIETIDNSDNMVSQSPTANVNKKALESFALHMNHEK